MNDTILTMVKELAGESFSDEWVEQLDSVIDPVIESSTATATDGLQAKLVAKTNAAKEAAITVSKLEEQLASAGEVDEALAKAREGQTNAEASVADLTAQLRNRDIRDAAAGALAQAEVDGAKIPEDRQAAALKLLLMDMSGVDLDEGGNVVGLEAKVEALKAESAFLWQAGQQQATGNGGPPAGGDPPPGKPKPKTREEQDKELGRAAVKGVFARFGQGAQA